MVILGETLITDCTIALLLPSDIFVVHQIDQGLGIGRLVEPHRFLAYEAPF